MKYIPILLKTWEVQAILDGRKTQTRRTNGLEMFNEDGTWFFEKTYLHEDANIGLQAYFRADDTNHLFGRKCPYGQPGDILWVRETVNKGLNGRFHYKTDELGPLNEVKWTPSIYMPKEACRLFLKVKSVRVERLQDITEQDAEAEGIADYEISPIHFKQYGKNVGGCESAITSFMTLWESINGPESWAVNPLVWVIEFERTEKPENFIQ